MQGREALPPRPRAADARLMAADQDVTRGIGERAASVLGPESDLLEDLDAAGLGQAATAALRAVAMHPAVPARAGLRLCGDLARIPVVAISRFVGAHGEPPVTPDPADRRFGDPAWDTNPAFSSIARPIWPCAGTPAPSSARPRWRRTPGGRPRWRWTCCSTRRRRPTCP